MPVVGLELTHLIGGAHHGINVLRLVVSLAPLMEKKSRIAENKKI